MADNKYQQRIQRNQAAINQRLKEERELRKKQVELSREFFAEASQDIKKVGMEMVQARKEAREEAEKEAQAIKNRVAGKTVRQANKTAIMQMFAIGVPTLGLTVFIGIMTLLQVGHEVDWPGIKGVLAVALPIACAITLIEAGIIFTNRRRVLEISKALEEAAIGNLDYRLDWYQSGVFGQAYIDFNRMCQQLRVTRKQMNKAVEEANLANSAKSNFLSNMSHEIRTPINAVLGMDEMIIRESREEDIRNYAMDIRSAGRTLLTIINDILDFSKIESGKMEIIPVEYDLSSVVNDLLNMTANKAKDKGLELKIEVDSRIPHLLYGDEVRIKQVALNVLNNAVKYTEVGSVTLSVYADPAEEDGYEYLCMRITDTGKGIKEEDMNKLFSPFERIEEKRNRNIEGTGLGMSITKNLLAMMDSQLEVSSVYGEGSDFSFRILQRVISEEPIGNFAENYHKSQMKEAVYTESFHAPNAKILVIDDVPMNLTVITGLLKKTQIKIDTGVSGRECLEKASLEHYDIIFVDHMMPDMDGIETMQHVKEECELNKSTPIIVLTANAVSGAREQYMAAGFDNYLTKPIDSAKLEATIRSYLPQELMELDIVPEERPQDILQNSSQDLREDDCQDSLEDNSALSGLRSIKMLDTDAGIKATGDADTYIKAAEDFYNTAADRIAMIEKYREELDYRNYTIQVHALKSSARILGDAELSVKAEYLEKMGNEENKSEILEKTGELISDYRELADALGEVFEISEDKPLIPEKLLKEAVCSIIEVVEAFDFDTADMIMEQLSEYRMPEDFAPIYRRLKSLMSEVEREGIIELLSGADI